MSSWQSEMTPEEWESVMGVPYSHISPEQQEKNRQFAEGFKRGLQELFEFEDGICTRCGGDDVKCLDNCAKHKCVDCGYVPEQDDSKGAKNDSSK